MNRCIMAGLGWILFGTLVAAQTPVVLSGSRVQREIHGQTLISKELPSADLTFATGDRYVGGQVVNLYGNAEAEQHLFVKGPSTGPVESFYWLQFEHFLPSNRNTYDYKPDRTTDLGGLPFIYDVKAFANYAGIQTDPGSDGAAMSALLAQHNLAFPRKAARVRMFYLPTPDRRTELMIIYGEALSQDSRVPVSDDGVRLDEASPESAKLLLEHARAGLTIQKH
jgi:hypothetical protein